MEKGGPTLTLNTGAEFPVLGFGTYDGNPEKTSPAVLHALRTGYRHLDGAWNYHNEAEVGSAVRDFLKENPDVKRSDLFVTTKLPEHLHSPADVEWSLDDSLRKLGLDYVDLFLIHWPYAFEKVDRETPKEKDGMPVINQQLTDDPLPTWEAMEKLHKAGKAKAIGVSNWDIKRLKTLLSRATIPPAVNQVEVHPYLPNGKLIQFCKDHNIAVAAYSPLGGQGSGENLLRTSKELGKLSEEQGHDIGQALIAWGIRRGYAVLPKSFTPGRIESNFKLVRLTDAEFEAVGKATGGEVKRFCGSESGSGIDVFADSDGR